MILLAYIQVLLDKCKSELFEVRWRRIAFARLLGRSDDEVYTTIVCNSDGHLTFLLAEERRPRDLETKIAAL